MKLLLDSHALLWALSDCDRLLASSAEEIRSPDNIIFFSPASIWELELKVSKGLLKLPDNLINEAISIGFTELPIRSSHALLAARLPAHHRDPFDRMLIAQANEELLTLVTRDIIMTRYQVSILSC